MAVRAGQYLSAFPGVGGPPEISAVLLAASAKVIARCLNVRGPETPGGASGMPVAASKSRASSMFEVPLCPSSGGLHVSCCRYHFIGWYRCVPVAMVVLVPSFLFSLRVAPRSFGVLGSATR